MHGALSDKISLFVKDAEATRQLGQDLALALPAEALIHLNGDLGAGKTELARSIIRNLLGEKEAEVPSPTFSLVQHYEYVRNGRPAEIVHADLYRTEAGSEVEELGLEDTVSGRVILVEWAEKAAEFLAPADISITFQSVENEHSGEGRKILIEGRPFLIAVITRSLDIRAFLDCNWQRETRRSFLLGDASSRSYETIQSGDEVRILMNAPRQGDGPVLQDGKPYSQIAHLAEDIAAFIGVARLLADMNMRVPSLYAHDLERGLLLLEDLGSEQIITHDRQPVSGRYIASAQMLADMHAEPLRRDAVVDEDTTHTLADYDMDAMLIETELLAEWYAPTCRGEALSQSERADFKAIWTGLVNQLQTSEKHLVLRDFHSPNILWQSRETGAKRIGLIDFQDAVIGPTAYDVASLAQDARVDISWKLEEAIVTAYCERRHSLGKFDEAAFHRDYAIMAAQRATKILGIFVRLDQRDGKPAYLKHLPRMEDYIARSFHHPVLAEYERWFLAVMEPTRKVVTQA